MLYGQANRVDRYVVAAKCLHFAWSRVLGSLGSAGVMERCTAMVTQASGAGQLERIPLFRSLSGRALRSLSVLVTRRELEKGDVVYSEGQPCDRFVIVTYGRLNVTKTSVEGREKVVSEIRARQHFGLAEIITGRRSNATIEAMEPTEILTLQKDDLVRTLLENPRMCYQLMQVMAGTILDLADQVEEMSFEPVRVRLASLLVLLADREGIRRGDDVLIRTAYSHQQLARRLGASRETVTRMLKRFREHEWVKTEGRRLVLIDREGLVNVIESGGLDSEGH
jgi:CRP-like cAMP-binding protein